jgi:hypothetical protein
MPRLDFVPFDGRIPKGDKLRRQVVNLLSGRNPADAVIALTDVYTGSDDFLDAPHAKAQMRQWVGPEHRFHPHVALHDFEAWLLPYWPRIQALAGSNRRAPRQAPENVNHEKPPARVLTEVFRTGSKGKAYVKPRDAVKILEGADLADAAAVCGELRAFLNTILHLCGG